jgi:hypothetical protein
MLLALSVCAVVAAVLAVQIAPHVIGPRAAALRAAVAGAWTRAAHPPERDEIGVYDMGRERRAESRARELLRSCVNDEEWAMYRDLGFLRVWGASAAKRGGGPDVAPYAYLIYPHKPILAYVPQTSRLLGEYCVAFPDRERPYGSSKLPASDDVLAKWLALTADERALIESSNLHLAGRQLDPDSVRADLRALRRWEGARIGQRRPDTDSVAAQ